MQEIGAIDTINRGFESCISTVENRSLNDVNCTNCGQCIQACPTGALHEKETLEEVWRNLKDPKVHVIVQTAPAVRVAVGEYFHLEDGANALGQLVTAMRDMGFDAVYDTDLGADLTVIEEANELVERLKSGENLPLFTSCCAACF